jgi:hypothetical protein
MIKFYSLLFANKLSDELEEIKLLLNADFWTNIKTGCEREKRC